VRTGNNETAFRGYQVIEIFNVCTLDREMLFASGKKKKPVHHHLSVQIMVPVYSSKVMFQSPVSEIVINGSVSFSVKKHIEGNKHRPAGRIPNLTSTCLKSHISAF
jgi:hypothetical protein